MHEKGHCFYGVPFSRPFSGSRSQERARKHGRAGRIGILLWHRGRAIYLLPDSQGVVHRPRFQTDNWRRENSIWLDVGPHGAFHTQWLAGRTKTGVHLLHPGGSDGLAAQVAVLKTHIINYAKTRNIYEAYRKASPKEKMSYRSAYEADLLLHEAAKRHKKNCPLSKSCRRNMLTCSLRRKQLMKISNAYEKKTRNCRQSRQM